MTVISLMTELRDKILEIMGLYEDSTPMGKQLHIIQMRLLFKKASVQDGLAAIDSMNEEWQFNVLLGVGMKGVWYYALAKRKAELMGL